jgi:hypothetical protein
MPLAILLANLVSTAFMFGLIWVIQVVHYPLFAKVGPERWIDYHHEHVARIGRLVGPAIGLEAISSLGLLFVRPAGTSLALAIIGVALVAVLAAVTFFVQVPQHARLAQGFDAELIRRLVRGNAVRAILWTLHFGVALAMVLQAVTAPPGR